MREIKKIEHEIGGDGAMVTASLGVDAQNLKLQAEVTYPVDKIASPAFKVIDDIVDKVEQWIPGDQTKIAAALKAEAREKLLALLVGKDEPQALPAAPEAEA